MVSMCHFQLKSRHVLVLPGSDDGQGQSQVLITSGILIGFTRAVKIACVAIAAIFALGPGACADEINVLTTGILKGSFPQIVAQFERETGHKVTMSWGPSSGNSPEAAQVRVRNGERIDVLIMVNSGMDALVSGGFLSTIARKDIAVSKIGVAVKEGYPLPDISTAAALRKALLDAKSIGYSEGASGTYVATVLLKKLGIAEEMAPKSTVILGRRFVGEALVRGEVELGIQQISELRLESGIVIVGPLPDDLQKASIVTAAIPSKAVNVDAAKQFYAYLSTPFAADAMKKSGVELPDGKS